MPEGHTIRRLATALERTFGGRVVTASSPQGRFADGAALLDGRPLTRADTWGKHLFARFDGTRLHVHLGLYGKVSFGTGEPPEARGALRLRLTVPDAWADLRGPTACEIVTPAEVTAIEARLGPDPLRPRTDPMAAFPRVARSKVALGALLMDQSVVAGVGNVYRAEVLFRAGISPFRPGREVRADEWLSLWQDLVALMRAGVRSGRIVTTLPEDRTRRSGRPTRDDASYVYRRAGLPCRRCGAEVQTQLMVGRNLYWCPQDQPR